MLDQNDTPDPDNAAGPREESFSQPETARLLKATHSTIIECAGCLSLGLVRPAIFAIRGQLELLLAWAYFNDHIVEFRFYEQHLGEFPTRSVFIKFFKNYSKKFDVRYQLLANKRIRADEDPYGLLSTHVHSASEHAAPKFGPLSSLVQASSDCNDCVKLQRDVAEYLTDVLAAWYCEKWQAFPLNIRKSLQSRLSAADLKKFCS